MSDEDPIHFGICTGCGAMVAHKNAEQHIDWHSRIEHRVSGWRSVLNASIVVFLVSCAGAAGVLVGLAIVALVIS